MHEVDLDLHGETDARVWAEEFAKLFLESMIDRANIDKGLMISWFANAIESGRMNLNDYAVQSHTNNAKWWFDADGNKLDRNKGEMLMLIVSEIVESFEGVRRDLPDEKLPHRSAEEVELADALIRIFDYAGAFGLDLEGAYQEKREFNRTRHDHTYEARAAEGGKKF